MESDILPFVWAQYNSGVNIFLGIYFSLTLIKNKTPNTLYLNNRLFFYTINPPKSRVFINISKLDNFYEIKNAYNKIGFVLTRVKFVKFITINYKYYSI